MGKMRILWNNLNNASATVLSSSSAATEYPLSNLQNYWKSWRTRTSSLASPDYWAWNLGSALPVSYVILVGHNFTSSATVKVQADIHAGHWADVNRTLVYGTDWNDDIVIAYFSTEWTTLQYWRITVQDLSNPDGYVEAAYAFVGSFFEPRYSFQNRAGGTVDPSIISKSGRGNFSAYVKDPYDFYEYSFSAMTPADRATYRSIFRTVGRRKPVFLIEDHRDFLDTTKYALLTSDFKWTPFAGDYKAWGFSAEEVL